MTNKDIKLFISYRWDGMDDLAKDLHNYFKNLQGYNSYLDQSEMPGVTTLVEELRQLVRERDCLISLLSIASLDRMLEYSGKRNHPKNKYDYVYVEIKTALENNLVFIPVCVEDCDMRIFERKLFSVLKNLGCNDNYPIIYHNKLTDISGLIDGIRRQAAVKPERTHREYGGVYWVGTRKSDIPQFPAGWDDKWLNFKGSICLFGDHSDGNNIVMCSEEKDDRVDHNDPSDKSQDQFIIDSIGEMIERDPGAKFIFYNPSNYYRLSLESLYPHRFMCINPEDILNIVNDKMSFRDMISGMKEFNGQSPLVPVLKRTKYDCRYDLLMKEYDALKIAGSSDDDDPEFIIQAPVASGGDGTFILNKDNEELVLSALARNATYLVSVYYKNNVSVNRHVIIYDDDIILTPGSIQLVRYVPAEHKLLFKGSDFITYYDIDPERRNEFDIQSEIVAKELQKRGYRGVCGIDAIIHDGMVHLMEVNGRFQASTELLNRALLSRGGKTLQELNMDAFNQKSSDDNLARSVNVEYSNYSYSYEGFSKHESHILDIARSGSVHEVADIQTDGYTGSYSGRISEAYLYRVAFNTNISSINEDGAVWIHENITAPDRWLTERIKARDRLAVKIALLIQGISFRDDMDARYREATNNAIDLEIEDMIINSPTRIRFVEFTPFSLGPSGAQGRYSLYYYGDLLLDNVGIFPPDEHQNELISGGRHTVSEVAYLSTDRLRVHTTNKCCFKLEGVSAECPRGNSCKFCNIQPVEQEEAITPADVRETVDIYMKERERLMALPKKQRPIVLRHFLLGGQSLQDGKERLVEIANVLGSYHLPVYVMTLPLDNDTVSRMIDAGVYEFAYNIEIFNKDCRLKYMPGKGKIPVDTYIDALSDTRKLLYSKTSRFNDRAVRSMVVVGLEPHKDMIGGIKRLIDNKIEPMLSVFRPLPDTDLERLNAPPIKYVYELFEKVSRMLYESQIEKDIRSMTKLGPQCSCCQNNTVSLPWKYQGIVTPREKTFGITDPVFSKLEKPEKGE